MAEYELSDDEAEALSDTIVGPGLRVPLTGARPWQPAANRALARLARAAIAAAAAEVYKDDGGALLFGVRAGTVSDGDDLIEYAGCAGQAVTDALTNYIYLTLADLAAGTVTVNTTGFPDPSATPHVRVATIGPAGGDFLQEDIVDCRGACMLRVLTGLTAAEAEALRPLAVLAAAGLHCTFALTGEWLLYALDDPSYSGVPGDRLLTEAEDEYALVYDAGTDAYAELVASSSLDGWTNDWQLTSDAANEGENDACYVGRAVPWCEASFDLATVGTYSAPAFAWEYWNGAAWAALTAYDGTGVTSQDGGYAFQRSGCVHWLPPADWAACEVNGQSAFWVRCRVISAAITQTPKTDAANPSYVEPENGIVSPIGGTVGRFRVVNYSELERQTGPIEFFLMNFTSGARSAVVTWPASKYAHAEEVALAVAAGDVLGIVVITTAPAAPYETCVELTIVPAAP